MMTDFTQMHTEVQCLTINIFGNTYMQVFMWMNGWMDGSGERGKERERETDGTYI